MEFKRPDSKKEMEFYQLFRRRLRQYWHPLFGFDVVKFDVDIQTPDGVSCADHISQTYGEPARKLVEGLL